jgi:hypothetical protein
LQGVTSQKVGCCPLKTTKKTVTNHNDKEPKNNNEGRKKGKQNKKEHQKKRKHQKIEKPKAKSKKQKAKRKKEKSNKKEERRKRRYRVSRGVIDVNNRLHGIAGCNTSSEVRCS